jgi:cytosine/adenosine deaminase-related metal-dependent hydrolase
MPTVPLTAFPGIRSPLKQSKIRNPEQMAILLKNTRYIDHETMAFRKTHILVESGLKGDIRFFDDLTGVQEDVKDVLDCQGKLVTRSFAVGHHHVYSALARGMPAPVKKPANFVEMLKYIWWNIDKNLDRDSIEASALATAMACAKSGSTFAIDHHASPNLIRGSLDIIRKAFEQVGIGHLLCYEITDRDGHDKALEGLEETQDYLSRHQGLVGLHASFTVDQNTLKAAVDLMNRTQSGVHIHVAEDQADQAHCLERYGKRVVERLNEAGALESSKTILVHCLHLNDNERAIVKNKPVYIAQNMESNLKNNVGYFSRKGLAKRIMLGTDGMHSDMIRSAQAAYFAGQQHDQIDYAETYHRLRNVHQYLKINHFQGDGPNNLIVLDYDSPTNIGEHNFLGHFLFGWRDKHIVHVISNGKWIVRDRQLLGVNETEVLAFCREQADKLWKRLA